MTPTGFSKAFIERCRQAHLEREFQEGDWYVKGGGPRLHLGAQNVDIGPKLPNWLPRLDQLLVLLEKGDVGYRDIEFHRSAGQWECRVARATEARKAAGRGSSREEAALDLYLAVTSGSK